jgi:hypothetical protein
VARFIRPQFSLATLLIAMAWSGVAVWVNITPRVRSEEIINIIDLPGVRFQYYDARWGWPCYYAGDSSTDRTSLSQLPTHGRIHYRAMLLDAVVGVLLVVVLTWASSQLLRRVTSRLRRGRLPPCSTN